MPSYFGLMIDGFNLAYAERRRSAQQFSSSVSAAIERLYMTALGELLPRGNNDWPQEYADITFVALEQMDAVINNAGRGWRLFVSKHQKVNFRMRLGDGRSSLFLECTNERLHQQRRLVVFRQSPAGLSLCRVNFAVTISGITSVVRSSTPGLFIKEIKELPHG